MFIICTRIWTKTNSNCRYLISKWNQLTCFKLGSVSTAYLLEDNVQKSFHNLGLLRKFKLSKFNFWEIQGIPQSWFDLVWWVELIEYLNPQQGWSPIMITHIWIKFIKIDIYLNDNKTNGFTSLFLKLNILLGLG